MLQSLAMSIAICTDTKCVTRKQDSSSLRDYALIYFTIIDMTPFKLSFWRMKSFVSAANPLEDKLAIGSSTSARTVDISGRPR